MSILCCEARPLGSCVRTSTGSGMLAFSHFFAVSALAFSHFDVCTTVSSLHGLARGKLACNGFIALPCKQAVLRDS